MDKLDNFTSKKILHAELLRKQGKYNESILQCDEIIVLYPNCYSAYNTKCYNLYDLGRYEEAFKELEQLIDLRPESASAYYLRAEWNLNRGAYFDVIEDADAIIHMNDEYFLNVAYFYKCLAYLSLNKKNEAKVAYLKLPNDFKYGIKTMLWGFKVWTKSELMLLLK